MPVIKPIAGHTGTRRIRDYLEKGGRALARDFFNLSWDENEMAGYDEALKDGIDWSDEMDRARTSFGNDRPFGGRPARTFVHYVLSPAPGDTIPLPTLRELSRAWVCKYLPDYQVAIVYHDDNAGRIPHAHIVVNNTNMATGYRIQIPDPFALNRGLQDMAEVRGLSFLRDSKDGDDGFTSLSAKDDDATVPPLTRQADYMCRAERRVRESGDYSWVSDIRDRVAIARNLARNESEFRNILDLLEVDVGDNSAKARRPDWIYSLRDQGAKRVGGEKLGYPYGKEALQTRFSRGNPAHPSEKSSRECLHVARSAVAINDLAELRELAESLDVNARFGIRTMGDYGRRIESLARKLDAADSPRDAAELGRTIERIEAAKAFSAEKGLLPAKRAKKAAKPVPDAKRRAAAKRARQGTNGTATHGGDKNRDARGREQMER